jgi:hypothetical protein
MNSKGGPANCEITRLHEIALGLESTPPESIVRQFKLWIRRHLDTQSERRFKRLTNNWANTWCALLGWPTRPASLPAAAARPRFAPGDLVRVRSQAEIEATLNHWHQLKGCTFMPEMAQYCGSRHCVLKVMERFIDERDLRVKKASGIVLLADVICQGTADFGRCDRCCFFFWREEWLEPVAPAGAAPEENDVGEVATRVIRPI